MDTEVIIVIIILACIVWIWRVINRHIARKANLVKEFTEHTGPKIASSGWYGRAKINGIYFKRAIKLIHYEQGYMLKLIFIFGGGKLWIPKKTMEIVEQESGLLFGPYITIKSGDNTVSLYGHLATFITEAD